MIYEFLHHLPFITLTSWNHKWRSRLIPCTGSESCAVLVWVPLNYFILFALFFLQLTSEMQFIFCTPSPVLWSCRVCPSSTNNRIQNYLQQNYLEINWSWWFNFFYFVLDNSKHFNLKWAVNGNSNSMWILNKGCMKLLIILEVETLYRSLCHVSIQYAVS